jgi:signal transduction histidine kinase
MQQTETIAFIAIFNIILLLFTIGAIIFIFEYRKRKKEYEKERIIVKENHIKQLLTAQLESQQETMQHIGIEIHDNVGQKLTLASLYSKQLISSAVPDITDKINTIGDIIDESLAELRLLSKTLTNPLLAQAGLIYLLREEAKRINASAICYLTISTAANEITLPPARKNILFRLLQEFIQNSLKHAACKGILIEISLAGDVLNIRAADDGKGFDTEAVSNGIGVQNMQRRAEQLNAIFDLKSKKNTGTTLTLQLQIN